MRDQKFVHRQQVIMRQGIVAGEEIGAGQAETGSDWRMQAVCSSTHGRFSRSAGRPPLKMPMRRAQAMMTYITFITLSKGACCLTAGPGRLQKHDSPNKRPHRR